MEVPPSIKSVSFRRASQRKRKPGYGFKHVFLLGNILNRQLGQWPQTIASYHNLQELLLDSLHIPVMSAWFWMYDWLFPQDYKHFGFLKTYWNIQTSYLLRAMKPLKVYKLLPTHINHITNNLGIVITMWTMCYLPSAIVRGSEWGIILRMYGGNIRMYVSVMLEKSICADAQGLRYLCIL